MLEQATSLTERREWQNEMLNDTVRNFVCALSNRKISRQTRTGGFPMLTAARRLLSFALMATAISTAGVAHADTGALSPRSLQKMARNGDPTASVEAFEDRCATVKEVTGKEFLWKSQISHHITSGDPRATGPTFICNRLCPKFPMAFYYSDGTKAGEVGYYGPWNVTGKARAYCAAGGAPQCFINQIATDSRRRGRDGFVYLQTSGAVKAARTVCYKVRPLSRTGDAM